MVLVGGHSLLRPHRRLVAILAADVVGYSRHMSRDEAGTLSRLKALRADVIDPKFAQFEGQLVGTAGDSLLVEFASAVDAVQCAVEIQERIFSLHGEMPDDQRMAFRMGINLGDVIPDDGTIYGDGVNVAARLGSRLSCSRLRRGATSGLNDMIAISPICLPSKMK